MKRRLLNLAPILSTSLSLAATVMWVRSGYVIDSWELVTHRHVESAAARLVWINYDAMEIRLTPPVFYHTPNEPLLPGQRGRDDTWQSWGDLLPPGTVHGRIPYMVEWYMIPLRKSRYVAVPWPTLALAFAVLPAGRWLWSRRRSRAGGGPAFQVCPAGGTPELGDRNS